MIKDCKICGISDPNTLNFIINHPFPQNLLVLFVTIQKVLDMLNMKI